MKKHLFLLLSLCVSGVLWAASDEDRSPEELSLIISDPNIHSLGDFFGEGRVTQVSSEKFLQQGKSQYYMILDFADDGENSGVWVSDSPLILDTMPLGFHKEFIRLMQSRCSSWRPLSNKKNYQDLLYAVVTQQAIPGCKIYAGPIFFPHGLITVGQNALTIDEINAHIVGQLRADDKCLTGLQTVVIVFIIVGVAALIWAGVVAHQYGII